MSLEVHKIITIHFDDFDYFEELLYKYFGVVLAYNTNEYSIPKSALRDILYDSNINEDFCELLLKSENLSQNDLDDLLSIDFDYINFVYD